MKTKLIFYIFPLIILFSCNNKNNSDEIAEKIKGKLDELTVKTEALCKCILETKDDCNSQRDEVLSLDSEIHHLINEGRDFDMDIALVHEFHFRRIELLGMKLDCLNSR